MSADRSTLQDRAFLNVQPVTHEPFQWKAIWSVDKRLGDWTGEQITAGEAPEPYERIQREGNLLVLGGISTIWEALIGNGGTAAGSALTYFNNAQSQIYVGTATAAAAAADVRLGHVGGGTPGTADATYPQHTDGTVAATNGTITFRSTFGTAAANMAWQEWGIANGTAVASRLLNHKVENLGTKTSAATWTFTVSLSIA